MINLNLIHLHLDLLTSMILEFLSRTLDNNQLVQVLPNFMFLYNVNTNNICAHSANKSETKYPIALERQGFSRDFPT